MAGRTVTRFESVYPALTRGDVDRPITGRLIEGVSSRGKHLLMAFSGDLRSTPTCACTAAGIYRPGERWHAPSHRMRIVIGTDTHAAVAFNVPIAEFLTGADLVRHTQIQTLGLTWRSIVRARMSRRLAAHGDEPIHDVLLNQRAVGHRQCVKSEVLFVARLNPLSVREMTMRRSAVDASLRLMRMNITDSVSLAPLFGRRTTGSLDPRAKLFVYGRGGKPSRTCGTPIEVRKTGIDSRLTYWCPTCQA